MIYIVLFFIASIFSACDKKTVYHAFHSLPTEGWLQKDTLLFDVTVPDSNTTYQLSLEIRNRNDYPYRNLSLAVCHLQPESSDTSTDTLNILLADEQGNWLGNGWGGLYQLRFPAGSLRITASGHHTFKIIHTFPDNPLPGINDIGIKLER